MEEAALACHDGGLMDFPPDRRESRAIGKSPISLLSVVKLKWKRGHHFTNGHVERTERRDVFCCGELVCSVSEKVQHDVQRDCRRKNL
jgi:hypothetical protein